MQIFVGKKTSRQFTFVRRIRKTRVAPLNPSHFQRRLVEATAATDGRQLLTHVDVHLRAKGRLALHLDRTGKTTAEESKHGTPERSGGDLLQRRISGD
jgi:hypothetical protein